MESRFFSGFGLVSVWLVVSVLVFTGIDALATRPVPVAVESFRERGMSDREVIAAAAHEASRLQRNPWWIHDRMTYLVLDPTRSYDVDSELYSTFNLQITAVGAHVFGVFTR